MKGQGSGPGFPDAVGKSCHGPDIGEVMGGYLTAHLRRESLQPGGLEEDTRWLTSQQKRQHLGHED